MIKGLITSFLIFSSSFSWAAGSKPFYFMPRQDDPHLVGFRDQQNALLRENLDAHINYVVKNVLPRAQKEIDAILQPQVLDGKAIYLGYNTDYADFFHFHIRYFTTSELTTFSDMTDSANYHLHYHTMEHWGSMTLQWLRQILALNDDATQVWAQTRIDYETKPSHDDYNHFSAPPPDNRPHLDEAGIQRLAQLWEASLAKSPGLEQVTKWVRVLDDKLENMKISNELQEWRSIASFDDRFEVIPMLDLPNISQPVTISFAEIKGNEDIAAVLRAYNKRNNRQWLGNYNGYLQEILPARENLKADSIATYNQILQLAQTKPADTTLHEALDKTTGTRFNTVITLDDRYIYTITYYIYTQEELDKY